MFHYSQWTFSYTLFLSFYSLANAVGGFRTMAKITLSDFQKAGGFSWTLGWSPVLPCKQSCCLSLS